ncbi:hypothetical protein BDN70DRAFT_712746 [Pholiota conissans]|uniref:Uncharacterized protein n=1 Tax=Pholiota conissans TaxID=109636 RepID=A0A9P5Z1D1_9AGAR|nr:hypothetical protein BDN70DRAFT_712746 [Pholiota conissans]
MMSRNGGGRKSWRNGGRNGGRKGNGASVGGVVGGVGSVGGVVIAPGTGGRTRRPPALDILDIAHPSDVQNPYRHHGSSSDDIHNPHQHQYQNAPNSNSKPTNANANANKRWSLMSDFQRWRRAAVRGSLGGVSLGIKFRRSGVGAGATGSSGSGDEKGYSPAGVGAGDTGSPIGTTNTNANGARFAFHDVTTTTPTTTNNNNNNNRPPSSDASLPSSGSTARRERALRKGKMRAVSSGGRKSWMMDWPTWLGGGGGGGAGAGAGAGGGRQSGRLSALWARHINDAAHRQGQEEEEERSFAATAQDAERYAAHMGMGMGIGAGVGVGIGAGGQAGQEHPPSYAASISLSNRDSIRDSHSDPSSFLVPSGPRSVSSNSQVLLGVDLERLRRESGTGNGDGNGNGNGNGGHIHSPTTQDVPVAMAPMGGVTVSSAPLRPLPNIAQHHRRLQQQHPQQHPQLQVQVPHIYAQTHPIPTNNPAHSRKIIDPRLIDASLEATATDTDNPSIVEPRIMREVLRSLSPRTSRSLPVPPPPPPPSSSLARRPLPMHDLILTGATAKAGSAAKADDVESPESVTSPTRRLLPLVEAGHELESRWMDTDGPPTSGGSSAGMGGGAAAGRQPVKALPRTPTSDDDDRAELIGGHGRESAFLNMPQTSPFRVDFETPSARTSGVRPLPSPTMVAAAARSIASSQSEDSGGSGGSVGVVGGRGGGRSAGGDAASSDESMNDQAYYTTAAESYTHKPARNTFGASDSSHGPPSSGAGSGSGNRLSMSDFIPGAAAAASSHLPFRLPEASQPQPQPHQAQPQNESISPIKPSPATSEGVVSFIDFTSSPEGSLRVPSERSGGSSSVEKKKRALQKNEREKEKERRARRRRSLPVVPVVPVVPAALPPVRVRMEDEPKSRWSNTTVPSIATNPQAEAHESSGDSQMHPRDDDDDGRRLTADSSMFPISISAVPSSSRHHLLPDPALAPTIPTTTTAAPAPHSHRTSSSQSDSNLHVHPTSMLENFESPTESLPLSTSEIRFRHASDSSGPSDEFGFASPSARRRRRGRHLSITAGDDANPNTAVEDEDENNENNDNDDTDNDNEAQYLPLPRPFDPTILVNRVLGMTPPTTSSSFTARPLPPPSRSPSNFGMSSSTGSVFPFNGGAAAGGARRDSGSNEVLGGGRGGFGPGHG